jgi:integrase
MEKRYKSLSHKGVRKDIKTGTYNARKLIERKMYSRNFPVLLDAKKWLNEFHPLIEGGHTDLSPTFTEIHKLYDKEIITQLEFATKETKRAKGRVFIADFGKVKVSKLNFDFFKSYFMNKKLEALDNPNRYSFDLEIKELKAIFNWYREFKDYTFIVPLTKAHIKIGKVRKKIPKNKKMTLSQVERFLLAFEDDLYRDLAIAQFFTCSRVSEVAGIQFKSINLNDFLLTIKDVVVWDKGKRFVELKPYTKNNEMKLIEISSPLLKVINKRATLKFSDSDYLFHINGEALSYRKIQHHYNKAFKKAGLDFSGTHTLRHSMASIARQLTGSIDSVQSLTGHKSSRQAEHYSGLTHHAQSSALNLITQNIVSDLNQ